jgi:hypothetical protein
MQKTHENWWKKSKKRMTNCRKRRRPGRSGCSWPLPETKKGKKEKKINFFSRAEKNARTKKEKKIFLFFVRARKREKICFSLFFRFRKSPTATRSTWSTMRAEKSQFFYNLCAFFHQFLCVFCINFLWFFFDFFSTIFLQFFYNFYAIFLQFFLQFMLQTRQVLNNIF